MLIGKPFLVLSLCCLDFVKCGDERKCGMMQKYYISNVSALKMTTAEMLEK